MTHLEDAMAEIELAERNVTATDVRTNLDSIVTSLQEMLDTAAGDETSGEMAFAESDVAGAAPTDDNLRELRDQLRELAAATEDPVVRSHLEAAGRHVESYRTDAPDRE